MTQHLAILPIIIPLFAGILQLLPPLSGSVERQRVFSVLLAALLIIAIGVLGWHVMHQGVQIYALGDWQPPFGIVLVADQLALLMLMLTAVLGLCAILFACGGDDKQGAYFYPLMQFQLMGINGAFLTGDLFNLFVFFEVLLIASYALLVHGGGKQRTSAAVHYVILNLVGSALFLFALASLYGTLGTLNIAHMSLRVGELAAGERAIAQAGGLLLLIVFGLKAALLPLHFWLPKTYASASAPVAALFAIMTKVGIYAIFRVYTVIFGDGAGELANMAQGWIWPLALLTLVLGAVGVLASPNLRQLVANLVIVSVGTLMVTFALRSEEATAAGLYYMIHSTLVGGALFLIADMIGQQRGKAFDWFVMARKLKQPTLLGILFFVAAMAVAGLPPLSGFIGKVLVLQAAHETAEMLWAWPVILVTGLVTIVALSRAGTTLFWRYSGDKTDAEPLSVYQVASVIILLLTIPMLVIFAAPVTDFTQQAASQLHNYNELMQVLLPGGQD
ncbi:Na(+)/H(+) antiporter subunit [Saliniradius amylolyticus]|uniref:Na(+)/H(+) antiporter subunit n=1 Tax=Saliniradius amylolyticus TaxID=2183582 RepID=A0A2S2E1B1_9ALTE|nr:monovalent cation/H+ antiporter subunit D [Saliniradius amylolyticus]AWL11379.1 Na(+)/H(+) antiporter subunit [Saliniradius amylolyticus]